MERPKKRLSTNCLMTSSQAETVLNTESTDHSNENGLDRYSPQHPLPEELQKMTRDDTVCKFCGVSYLIHREIKLLEDRLEALEKELAVCRGAEEREALMKHEFESVSRDLKAALLAINEREAKLVESENNRKALRVQLDDVQVQLTVCEKETDQTKLALVKEKEYRHRLVEGAGGVRHYIQQLRSKMAAVQQEIVSWRAQSRQVVMETVQKASNHCLRTQKGVALLLHHERSRRGVFETSMTSMRSQLEQGDKDRERLEGEMETLRKEHHSWIETRSTLQAELETLKTDLDEEKRRCRQLVMECDQHKDIIGRKNKDCDNLVSSNNQRLVKLEDDLNRVKSELLQKAFDLEQSQTLKEDLRIQYEDLLSKQREIERLKNESGSELNEVKTSLANALEELTALRSEREKMIFSHQSRIEQLKESYREKMKEATRWPEKLEAALRDERMKHSDELTAQERSLTENFEMELEIQKQKHQELLNRYREEKCQSDNAKVKAELAAAETRYNASLAELRDLLAKSRSQHEASDRENQTTIDKLQATIEQLKRKLDDHAGLDPCEVLQLKSELCNHKTKRAELYDALQKANRDVEAKTELVQTLQETVRRECEERFELMEALSQTKEELLAFRRPPNGYSGNPSLASQSRRNSLTGSSSNQNGSLTRQPSAPSQPLPGTRTITPVASAELQGRRQSSSLSNNSARSAALLAAAKHTQAAGSLMATKRRLAAIMTSNKS